MTNNQHLSPNPVYTNGRGTESLAMDHLRAGRFDEAASVFKEVVEDDPQHWRGLHLLGLIAQKQGRSDEAAQLIRQALHIRPDLAEGHSDLGVVLKDQGRFQEAREACETAINLKPGFYPAYSNLGNIFKALGRLEDAITCYGKALAVEPGFADALINLASTLLLMKRYEEALPAARKAVRLAPMHAEAHVVLGHALHQAGDLKEAMKAYIHALELRPEYGPVYSDLGCLLDELGEHEEAIQAHEKALLFSPNYAEAHNNLGIALRSLGRYQEAIQHYRHAIALKADYAEAYSNMGTSLDLLARHDEAVEAYRRAVAMKPDLTQAYINLAGSLWEKNKLPEAISAYSYGLSIDPDQPAAFVDLYNLRRHACDWRDLLGQEQKILSATYRKDERVAPFPILNIHGDPAEEQACARAWAKGLEKVSHPIFEHAAVPSPSNPRRVRIGYLSADFCRHATASLISELIETHDRERFEVFGYSYGRDDQSGMRGRLAAAFDTFVDIQSLPHSEASRRIHGDEIDILIDLKGYTTHTRTEILAQRPAPIQVNYLGYPGTMGAPFIDYLIADPFIVPAEEQAYYDEKIVYLPHCYQPNDTKRRISPHLPSRAECGLPDQGFVFCSFNNNYKISPEIFDIWMRLLGAVPGSVLWLLEANSLVKENLMREAATRRIDPERIVFAPKQDLGLHLARHIHADLFLDTLPVNAHTTTSDALWVGLPVLTCTGRTFASRVAGSLVRAAGLPELVTDNLADYERIALRLAENPAELEILRQRLTQSRETSPLFDIRRYTRDLESAFQHMVEIAAGGGAPRTFAVAGLDHGPTQPPAGKPRVVAMPAAKAKTPPAPQTLSMSRLAYDACPLCYDNAITRIKDADCSQHPLYHQTLPPRMVWCRCGACEHVFTDGYFAPEAASLIFSQTLPHQTLGHEVEQQRVIAARIVERVARHAPSGDWLDIGFGNGSLLFTAQEWGFTPVGLDLRNQNVEGLRRLGIEAHCAPVEALNFAGRFSVVSMADVLEHIPYPRPALQAVNGLLKEGGVLFVSMPNMDAMIWRLMDASDANPYWGEIEHYHNFTRTRLYRLLEQHGFAPLQYGISERYRACMEVIAARR